MLVASIHEQNNTKSHNGQGNEHCLGNEHILAMQSDQFANVKQHNLLAVYT